MIFNVIMIMKGGQSEACNQSRPGGVCYNDFEGFIMLVYVLFYVIFNDLLISRYLCFP